MTNEEIIKKIAELENVISELRRTLAEREPPQSNGLYRTPNFRVVVS